MEEDNVTVEENSQEDVGAVEPDDDTEQREEQTASIIVPRLALEVITSAPSGTKILSTCIDLAVFLAGKNAAYGNSALDPVRVFSKVGPKEQILVRMDDKISRLMRGGSYPGDDDLKDLLGYLLLYFVAESNE
jgi:hypothetical protein